MAQAKPKHRTISYLRAVWRRSLTPQTTLQRALAQCLTLLTDAPSTKLSLRNGSAEIRHRSVRSDRICLHIAAWTDQEPMSTVPHILASEADLSSEPPGTNWDYLDGDGMILISGNHCLLMPSGLHPKSIEQYIRSLLSLGREQGAAIQAEMEHFQLLAIADPHTVEQVYDQGIKKIGLNVGQYMETARERDDVRRERIVERLGKGILMTLFTKEEDRRRVEEADNVSAQLIVKLDTRRSGLSAEEFVPVARKIADESEDDLEIETTTGQRIKRGSLMLRKPTKVKSFAKTVHHNHAWELMIEYFHELEDAGILGE